ncbi:hypothetical protein SPHV1_2160005 [Novosphingobium sp. KN65.2]|nr:hypothetical protein SPHV1_2160005 [Novosphingobium sp. KN65.2]
MNWADSAANAPVEGVSDIKPSAIEACVRRIYSTPLKYELMLCVARIVLLFDKFCQVT